MQTVVVDVAHELGRAGVGDVDASTLTRALYSTDASLYRVVPQVVVRPRSVDEVLAAVSVADQTGVPITPRGAGTSVAGNAVGAGIVLDFSKYLNRVHEIDPERQTARVDPGVVHTELQRSAAPCGLRYGPDPSTHTRCTVGGMIANNACGNRALGYGRAADNIAQLEFVTAGGQLTRTTGGARSPVTESLRRLVGDNLATIRTEFGRFGRQVSGYSLEHLLPENSFDVASFMAGSEGTLGLITGATVRLAQSPKLIHLVLLAYPTMADAADDVESLLSFEPVACEGLGARIVEVYRQANGAGSVPDMPAGGGYLYVELAGDNPDELASLGTQVVRTSAALGHRHVVDPGEQATLWRIREEGAGLASRIWDRPAMSGWEDAAVPPARLGGYLREFTALMTEHRLHGEPFGHFGDGCVHARIDFALDEGQGREQYRNFIFDAAELAARHGGSFSGEHGDGRARSELLPLMYSGEAMKLFGQVKQLFDPKNVMNPGVLVQPRAIDDDLRGQHRSWPAGMPPQRRGGLRLLHDEGSFGAAAHRCTGVGKCVVSAPASSAVMCPSFQATRNEKDSTRGRARVLQEMIDGRLVTGGWSAPEVHDALDLCLSCKGCASDCPTGTDMATLKSEVLHRTYAGRLRPRSHYVLGRLPMWAKVAAPIAWLANLAVILPGLKHAARAAAGVDQRRSLPKFERSGLRRGALSRWMRRRAAPNPAAPLGSVLVWADSFTDYFSSAGGRAAVEVLERAGYRVETLDRPACCGLTWITTGQLDQARRILARTVQRLHPYAAAGVPVVGVEPSCSAALRTDAVELLDDPRATEVAANLFTLAELLQSTPSWQPPDLTGTSLVVQPHCHQASVVGFDADLAVLQATGAQVRRLGGCCGLAGNFGVEKGHYEVSVAVAEQQLLPAVREASAEAIVVADGFSCRTQLDDLAQIQAIHLAQVLAGDRPNPGGHP